MTETDYKNDFFEGRFYEAGKKKSRLVNRCSEKRAAPDLKIPVEYAFILVIVVVTFVTVAYAIGVKNGKASVKNGSVSKNNTVVFSTPNTKAIAVNVISDSSLPDEGALLESIETENVVLPPATENVVFEEQIQEEEQTQAEQLSDSELLNETEYIVCLASFKNKKFADKDISSLTLDGVPTRLAKKGDWYQLYAEGFTTIDEARKAKEKLSETYKDCYVKRIK